MIHCSIHFLSSTSHYSFNLLHLTQSVAILFIHLLVYFLSPLPSIRFSNLVFLFTVYAHLLAEFLTQQALIIYLLVEQRDELSNVEQGKKEFQHLFRAFYVLHRVTRAFFKYVYIIHKHTQPHPAECFPNEYIPRIIQV